MEEMKEGSFDLFPNETFYKIIESLSYDEITKLCNTSKEFQESCNDRGVWYFY